MKVNITENERKAILGALYDRTDINENLEKYYPKWEIKAIESIRKKLGDGN